MSTMNISLPDALKSFVDEQVNQGGYAHELNLPGLRFWPLARYPHLVFYVERPQPIEVWRVLHGQRDIPAWMQQPETI